ncbi:MAG: hypothetical protein ACXVEF_20355 [Polyangiales bacterium]
MYRSVALGRVLFVRWETAPTTEDLAAIRAHASHLTSTLGSMIYVSLTPKRALAISIHRADDPSEFVRLQREIVEHATETHLVLENQRLLAAATKSALAVVQAMKNQNIHVHADVEELVDQLSKSEKLDRDFIRRELGRLVFEKS